jgi:hypothetical protein
MDRPELKQRDLEEVDRLVAIANACNRAVFPELPSKQKPNIIRLAALERAAEIMGLSLDDQEGADDAEETDEDTKEEDPGQDKE